MSEVAKTATANGPLSDQEREHRDNLIAVVKQEVGAFVRVGMALMEIQDKRLYRETHDTFELFCRDVFGFTSRYGRLQIEAAKVIQNLQADGERVAKQLDAIKPAETIPLPTTEAQVRPLTKLKTEKQPKVWQQAVETAPGREPTAGHVAATARKHLEDETRAAIEQGCFSCPEDDCKETFRAPHWHCECGKHGHWSKVRCSCGRAVDPKTAQFLCEWEFEERAKIPGWPLDGLGLPILDHMRGIFEQRSEFQELNRILRQCQRAINNLAQSDSGVHLRKRLTWKQDGDGGQGRYISPEIHNARQILEHGEPYTICPYCYREHPGVINANCAACKGSGFVPADTFERAPDTDQSAVKRLVPKQTMAA